MAEGLQRHFAGDQFEVYSAGLEPKVVNPYAIQAMHDIGLEVRDQISERLQAWLREQDITPRPLPTAQTAA